MDKGLEEYLNSGRKEYLSHFNSKDLTQKSKEIALDLFHKAARSVPAYKDFLQNNKVDPQKVKSFQDFKQLVPLTSKENYITKYSLKDRCWAGEVTKSHTFAASSGSTGEPIFWPRDIKQEVQGALIHELLFNEGYKVYKRKTLFINSFGLGNWIAGLYTEMCLYLMKLKGVPFSLASPGYNQEETFKVIREFSHLYDQTIIACHPPILKMMVENGKKEGINWGKINIKFLGAGEGFSESWRDYLLGLVNQKDEFSTFFNIYGSSDAGLMGFETPLSILTRRVSSRNHKLNKNLFKSERNPYLYQFDPTMKYLESDASDEIVITTDATAPLIRYNIHDHGDILSFEEFHARVRKHDKLFDNSLLKSWRLPFVYIFGRKQFMVSLYGVNIYPENVKSVIEHQSLQPYLTGRYILKKKIDNNEDQLILLRVELKPDVKPKKKINKLIKKLFIKILRGLNSEYEQVEDRFKEKMHPKIALHKYQDSKYFPKGEIKKMA